MEEIDAESDPNVRHESFTNKLISMIYSGPTIGEVETALLKSFQCNDTADCRTNSRPVLSYPEKGMGKIEHKYTVKMKNLGNGHADDGYKWRKYGQKSIKNSLNPRSYYRCTNPRCSAKKQVERSMEDPETLIVTYEGLHLHYSYSHLVLPSPIPQDYCSAINILEVNKKPKLQTDSEDNLHKPETESSPENYSETSINFLEDMYGEDSSQGQGLLEDVVPLLVRNPYVRSTSAPEKTSVSGASSPNSSLSSSVSWSPMMSPLTDIGLLSSII